MSPRGRGAFRSLGNPNYRTWFCGAVVSNTGTWMQRTAQDWLVLTQLTNHDASTVGLVMALQFGPQFLFLPLTGYVADHFNQRRLMMFTQATMGALALGLGLLTITGLVQLWHVYVFAFLFGGVAAFDAPVRQTFVSSLVGDADLPNAVALNSTSFNAGRMIGPAVAGLVIASIGTGWAFMINGASFLAVLASLFLLNARKLAPMPRARRAKGAFGEGLRYVWSRPDLKANLFMLFLVGTFGMNFAIFISTMAVRVFQVEAGAYGLLTSAMAVGTIAGALLAAGRERPRFRLLVIGAALFGLGCTLAAVAPVYWLFGCALVFTGIFSMTFNNSTNALMQLATEPSMRGRVMALRMSIAMGGTPIGAPIVGWVADAYGPRWSMMVGAAGGFAAALVGVWYLIKHRNLRLRMHRGVPRFSVDGNDLTFGRRPALPDIEEPV